MFIFEGNYTDTKPNQNTYMKKYLFRITLLTLMVMSSSLFAQNWVEMMKNPEVNFYDVQKAFNKYYVKKERQVERMKRRQSKKAGEGVHQEDEREVGVKEMRPYLDIGLIIM